MPMAAVIADPDLDCGSQAALGHYVHEKSPVGCAAALATLDVIETEDLVRRASVLGEAGFARLNRLKARHELVADVRHQGCFFGVEIECRRPTLRLAPTVSCMRAWGAGSVSRSAAGNVLTFCPPLTISDDEFEDGLAILEAALIEACG